MKNESVEIKVWTPLTTGLVGFFMGFEAGALLAAINAHRLSDSANKRKYIITGILYFPVSLFFSFSMNDFLTALAGIVNIALAYWLYSDTKNKIEEYSKEKNIADEIWWKGVLLGGIIWVITLIIALPLYRVFFALLMMFISQ